MSKHKYAQLDLTLDELYDLDRVLDNLIELSGNSVIMDWYFHGIDMINIISIHKKMIDKIEVKYAEEHMKVNERDGRKRLQRL